MGRVDIEALGEAARRAQRHAVQRRHDIVEQQLLARHDAQRRVPRTPSADGTNATRSPSISSSFSISPMSSSAISGGERVLVRLGEPRARSGARSPARVAVVAR